MYIRHQVSDAVSEFNLTLSSLELCICLKKTLPFCYGSNLQITGMLLKMPTVLVKIKYTWVSVWFTGDCERTPPRVTLSKSAFVQSARRWLKMPCSRPASQGASEAETEESFEELWDTKRGNERAAGGKVWPICVFSKAWELQPCSNVCTVL